MGREGEGVWGGRERECGEGGRGSVGREGEGVWGGRERECGEGGSGSVGREEEGVWGGRERECGECWDSEGSESGESRHMMAHCIFPLQSIPGQLCVQV